MRQPCRFSAFLHAILFVVLIAPILLIAGNCCAQARVSMRLVSARGQQAASTPLADWDAAVRELVDRVAAMSTPERIDLAMKNMSSLSEDEVATIGERLRTELAKRHFRLAGAQAADASLTVTLSEGADGYVIVAQVRRAAGGQAEQVAMVSVSRAAKKAAPSGGVSLAQTRVWEQPGAILDFALPPVAAGATPEMIVLERGRLAFYSRLQDQWQLSQAVTIQPTRSWLRTEQGHIDISQGLAMGAAGIPGIECKGDFANPETIHCGFVSQDTQTWMQGDAAVPKGLGIGGDAAAVGLECDGRPVVLASGKSDWTQPDSIQAYEIDTTGRAAAISTGNSVEFAGPVLSMWATGTSGVARAAVHNLKTGNYEAWVVTASCGR
jgi:hypothetical protein